MAGKQWDRKRALLAGPNAENGEIADQNAKPAGIPAGLISARA
jgi:hypothetical protein